MREWLCDSDTERLMLGELSYESNTGTVAQASSIGSIIRKWCQKNGIWRVAVEDWYLDGSAGKVALVG